jgi:hypothetical protein
MVAKQASPTEEQAAREALAVAIADAAGQVLAEWEDDRLLGQPRQRTISQVKRAVRVTVGRFKPELAAQVTSWRLHQLLNEIVPRLVGATQAQALRRRMEAEGEPPLAFQLIVDEDTPAVADTTARRGV